LDHGGITDDIHLFNEKLREWEDYYNYHRPHGALDGQTPYERLLSKTRAQVSSWDTAKNAIPTGSTRIILPSGEGPRRTVIDFAATVHSSGSGPPKARRSHVSQIVVDKPEALLHGPARPQGSPASRESVAGFTNREHTLVIDEHHPNWVRRFVFSR
jgi:hypothetical protein